MFSLRHPVWRAKLLPASALTLLFFLASPPVGRAQGGVRRGVPPAPTVEGKQSRDRDGLAGPVRRVRTEVARLRLVSGRIVEQPRVLIETAAYSLQGERVESAYYVVDDYRAGEEEYRYDDNGHVVETIIRDRGEIVSREIHKYEFDAVGNWTKMTTFVVVVEADKVGYEPVEVTHRAISYYPGVAVARASEPASSDASPTPARAVETSDAEARSGPPLRRGVATGPPSNGVGVNLPPAPRVTGNGSTAGPGDAGAPARTDAVKIAPLLVAGAVNAPGNFHVAANLGLHEALLLAGGANARAGHVVYVVCGATARGLQTPVGKINLVEMYGRAAVEEGRVTLGLPLRAGDAVFIPEADVAFVMGAVANAGAVRVAGRVTLLSAMRDLGGTLSAARRDQVLVLRPLPDGSAHQRFTVSLSDIEQHRAGDIALRPGDVVEVPPSGTGGRAQSFAALLRHVTSDGRTTTGRATRQPL